MNTPTPSDPRSLAHRLTTVGHALHHRLFAQLRDSDQHPKTVMVLSVIDGRLDARVALTSRLLVILGSSTRQSIQVILSCIVELLRST